MCNIIQKSQFFQYFTHLSHKYYFFVFCSSSKLGIIAKGQNLRTASYAFETKDRKAVGNYRKSVVAYKFDLSKFSTKPKYIHHSWVQM